MPEVQSADQTWVERSWLGTQDSVEELVSLKGQTMECLRRSSCPHGGFVW